MRICLGVPGRPCDERTERTRCTACQRVMDRQKNQRAGYRRTGEWQRLSRATRKATPYCVRCGAAADLTADHVTPRSLAGGVVTLCRKCNAGKADRR